MYMWSRFDLAELREDFAHIHDLRLQVVRFFLMWEDFQPDRERIATSSMRRLESVMDAVAEAGLLAMPSFFTGHMSGVNFVPRWALDRDRKELRFRTFSSGEEQPYGCGDFYSGELFDAMCLQARTVGKAFAGHPALYLWDLGNEFSNVRQPSTPAEAAAWSARLSANLLEASGAGVTAGNHGEDLTQDRNFRFESFCKPLHCAVMHGYSVYSDFARGRTDPQVVPFLCQLMQSLSGKPVLFNEFGNPTCPPGTVSPYDRVPLPGEHVDTAAQLPKNAAPYACLTEEEMAMYCSGVLDRLQKRGALGAFWWCWADYDPSLAKTPPFDRAPHELSFGVIRSDGSEKPVAQALQAFAAEERSVVDPPAPIVRSDDAWFGSLPGIVKDRYRYYLAEHV